MAFYYFCDIGGYNNLKTQIYYESTFILSRHINAACDSVMLQVQLFFYFVGLYTMNTTTSLLYTMNII